jgi:hypothetical protein
MEIETSNPNTIPKGIDISGWAAKNVCPIASVEGCAGLETVATILPGYDCCDVTTVVDDSVTCCGGIWVTVEGVVVVGAFTAKSPPALQKEGQLA